MIARPFPLYALCLCAGIAVRPLLPAGPWVWYCAASAALAGAIRWRNRPAAFLICTGLCWAAFGMLLPEAASRSSERRAFAYRLSNTCAARGQVVSEPRYEDGMTRLRFRAEALSCAGKMFPLREDIEVRLDESLAVSFGDGLVLRGEVSELAYSARAGGDGGAFTLRVPSAACVQRLPQRLAPAWAAGAAGMRGILRELIKAHVRGVPGDIMAGMLLGDKTLIPPLVIQDMVRTGTIHLLIVSGSHVGIVAACFVFLLRLLHVPRRLRFAVVIPLLAVYAAVTGGSAPVARAVLMAGTYMMAYPLRREPDIHNAWALAMMLLLVSCPGQLYNLGFQLSFVSVMAIIYVYPLFRCRLIPETVRYPILRAASDGIALSAAVWVCTAGIIAAGCRIFSPVTVLANLVLVPLAALATVSGFVVLAAALVCPSAAAYFGAASEALLLVIVKVNALLLKLPLAYVAW